MASVARLSIILPTYNRRDTVLRAARSVLAQTFPNFELLIVDDGSTDGTESAAGSLDDPRVRYLRLTKRRGAGAARNAGIRYSSAPLLAFQDSDDVWRPDKLERQMTLLDSSSPRVGVIYSDMIRVYRHGVREYHDAPDVFDGELIRNGRYAVYGIGIQTAIIKRTALEDAGWFDESLPAFEDLELFIRLSRQCAFRRIPEPLVLYAKGGKQISGERDSVIAAREKLFRAYREEIKTVPAFFFREYLAIQRDKLVLRAQRAV